MQRQVHEFHREFGLVAPDRMDVDGFPADLRVRLIREECDELERAANDRDVVGVIDALCDILYVTLGSAVSLGVDLEPYFDEVHRSNMAKKGGWMRDDGKWMKPEGWVPPRIAEMLDGERGGP